MPPGRSASAAASRHSQGASMSRMIRSQRSPEAGSSSARSPSVSVQAGWLAPAEELGDVAPGDVGELLAPLVGRHPARRADGAQQRAGQRPGADAGLDDVGAGEDVGRARRSGRRPWGRPPRRRGASRPRTPRAAAGRRGTRPPAEEVTVKPSSRPISSSCSRWPLLEKNRLPGSRQKLCRRPLLSTRRTHSPRAAGRGARRTRPRGSRASSRPVSHLGTVPSAAGQSRDRPEGAVDVGGGQHAVDRAVVLDQEVLGGRGGGDRPDQVLAARCSRAATARRPRRARRWRRPATAGAPRGWPAGRPR